MIRTAALAWHVVQHPGSGSVPAVFLHGFLGSGAVWAPVLAKLGREALTVDLPGHGATPLPAANWSLAEAAEDLLAALPERFDLVGYSLGGRLALHLALEGQERVRRLAVIGANPGIQGDAERMARRAGDEDWVRLIEDEGVEAFMRRWDAQPLFATRQAPQRGQPSPEGLTWTLRQFGTGQQAPLQGPLAACEVPTLWLAGELDQRYVEVSRAMAAAMPQAQFMSIPHCGHDVPGERPEALADVLAAFLGSR